MAQQFGFMQIADGNGDENAVDFAIRQVIRSSVQTIKIVEIVAVDTAAKTVDVQPLVQQVTPDGSTKDMPIVSAVPYGYEQAGNCLIQIDPAKGDIGVIACADRDIHRVKTAWKAAAPQTLRSHSLTDAIYLRTLYTGQAAAHTIRIDPTNGITVTSSKTVTVNADVQVNGNITATGTITGQTDVVGDSVSVKGHVHSGVQTGSGETGKPV